MNKKHLNNLSCFTSTRIDNGLNNENNTDNITSNKIQSSNVIFSNAGEIDTSSLHSSTSSVQNGHILRPKPPPYEYTVGKYGIPRSHSNYATYHDTSLLQDNDKFVFRHNKDEVELQFSDGDPPRLTDNLSKLNKSCKFSRPITFRPISPVKKRNYRHSTPLSKNVMDSQQSPSGDSGVRLTPNETDQNNCFRDLNLRNVLPMSSDNDNVEELKILKLFNSKLSLNEVNNQHLIIKATHLIGKLRQKMKEKDAEICNLKNKLKETPVRPQLLGSSPGSTSNYSHHSFADRFTQTSFKYECDETNLQFINQLFEEERAVWLEEKALVISYHKQLKDKYNSLLEKNTHLQEELKMLQGKYITDTNFASDTSGESVDEEDEEQNLLNMKPLLDNVTTQTTSRLVKFEESLC